MEPTRVSHFEITRLIGRGGMGEVHEATDLKLRRPVALKFLSPELSSDAAALTRFEREALAAAELNHPHIATVYAFEKDGDRPFIAMELLAGSSLRDRIDTGPLPIAEALAIARDVASALAYAHRRGTSHRDIKPENLMFDEHGEIKIMDFGLARATMASKLTVTGTSLGTPAYMAPEAIRGQTGPEGDVFALGLVLYEMIAGRRAFPGDNAMAVMFAIANEDPPPLAAIRPEVPEAVETLVRGLLAKDPAERIDAAAAARGLGAMTGVSVSVSALGGPGSATSAASGATTSGAATVTAPPRVAVSPQIGSTSVSGNAMPTLATAEPGTIQSAAKARRRVWIWPGAAAGVAVIAIAGVMIFNGVTTRKRDEAVNVQRQATEADAAGDSVLARALYLKAIDLDPTLAGALINLGFIYVREGRYTQAESMFNTAIRQNPGDTLVIASAHSGLGSSYSQSRAYDPAIRHFQTALSLDSSNANIYNNLSLAMLENGQPNEALGVLQRGIKAFPGEKFLYKNAGLAALRLGDGRQATAFLDRALQLDSTFTEARELRAKAAGLKP